VASVRITIQKEQVEAFRAFVQGCRGEHFIQASVHREYKGKEIPSSDYYPVVFIIVADSTGDIFALGVQWGKELERGQRNG